MPTATTRTTFTTPVPEKSTRTYRTVLTLDDAPAPLAQITAIVATLIDVHSGAVINSLVVSRASVTYITI